MNISKFFCMVITGLAIIGFNTIGMATQDEGKQSEEIKSEATEEGESSAKEESEAESKEEIQYGAEPWIKAPEGLRIVEDEAKVEEKE